MERERAREERCRQTNIVIRNKNDADRFDERALGTNWTLDRTKSPRIVDLIFDIMFHSSIQFIESYIFVKNVSKNVTSGRNEILMWNV